MDANIKTIRDALEWLDKDIEEEAWANGEMSVADAIRIGFIRDMLKRFPLRNCDVGTVDEQTRRLRANCEKYKPTCNGCKFLTDIRHENCWLKWAQTPYEEGGNNEHV